MKALLNVIKWTIYSMIVFVIFDFVFCNPSLNAEYIVRLLIAFSMYLIAWGIYCTIKGE